VACTGKCEPRRKGYTSGQSSQIRNHHSEHLEGWAAEDKRAPAQQSDITARSTRTRGNKGEDSPSCNERLTSQDFTASPSPCPSEHIEEFFGMRCRKAASDMPDSMPWCGWHGIVVAFESSLQDISQCEVSSGVSDQRGLSQAFFHHLEQVARAPRTLRSVGVTVGLDPNAESASECSWSRFEASAITDSAKYHGRLHEVLSALGTRSGDRISQTPCPFSDTMLRGIVS
jgi:hypothetical protein